MKEAAGDRAAVVTAALHAVSNRDVAAIEPLLHDELAVEYPYNAHLGTKTKASFLHFLTKVFETHGRFDIEIVGVHPAVDSDIVVVEFRSDAAIGPANRPYRNHYIGVFAVEGGQIKLWREFADPLALERVRDAVPGRRASDARSVIEPPTSTTPRLRRP